MKTFKKILSLALVAVMALAVFSGCKKADTTEETKDPYETPDSWSSIEEEKKANPDGITLTIAIRNYKANNKNAWQSKVFEEFKKQYPYVTLNFLDTTYGDFDEKVVAEVNAGNAVDIMFIGVNEMPNMALRNLVQPLQGFVDMKNPDLKLSAMDAAFKYGENHYVAASEINFAVIYYNKDLFANAGETDPMTLYQAGAWNWNTFSKAGRNMTRYLNQANGVTSGYYGYASEYPYQFLGMNNTSILKLDDNGKYVLNMDDPALAKALENYQKANFEDKWSGWTESSSPLVAFQEGRAAMYGQWTQFSFENSINGIREQMGLPVINYGVVPLPACQNNPEGVQMLHSAGYAIGKTSKAPAHAGKLIDMLVSADVAQQAEQDKQRPAAHVELYKKMANECKLIAVNVRDSGVGGGYDLMNAVTNADEPMTVAQAIEKFKPVYQREIEEVNKGGKK